MTHTVTTRQIRRGTDQYMPHIEAGQPVVLTTYNKPIAVIVPMDDWIQNPPEGICTERRTAIRCRLTAGHAGRHAAIAGGELLQWAQAPGAAA